MVCSFSWDAEVIQLVDKFLTFHQSSGVYPHCYLSCSVHLFLRAFKYVEGKPLSICLFLKFSISAIFNDTFLKQTLLDRSIVRFFYCILERLTTFSIVLDHYVTDTDSSWNNAATDAFLTQYIMQSWLQSRYSTLTFKWVEVQLNSAYKQRILRYEALHNLGWPQRYNSPNIMLYLQTTEIWKILIWASYTLSIRYISIQQYSCFIVLPYHHSCVTKYYSIVPKFYILYQCSVLIYLTKKSHLTFQQEQ
jgi:hypothetical protein